MIIPVLEGLTLARGVSGGHDYILIPDLSDSVTLTPQHVTALCDRFRGLGASGVIRVSTTSGLSIDVTDHLGMKREPDDAVLRIAAHYMRLSGLIDLADGETVSIQSQSATHEVMRNRSEYTTTHVLPQLPGGQAALDRGYDVAVTVDGLEGTRGGLAVSGDRTHIVLPVESTDELVGINLGKVAFDPPDDNAHVILVVPQGETTVTDFDGVDRPVAQSVIMTENVDAEALAATAFALRAWSGFTGPDILHISHETDRFDVRLFETDLELTAPAEIIAEFQLAGIAGQG